MMQIPLPLPCPFCGDKARVMSAKYVELPDVEIPGEPTGYIIRCRGWGRTCSVSPATIPYSSEIEAIEAWNRRAEINSV